MPRHGGFFTQSQVLPKPEVVIDFFLILDFALIYSV